VLDVFGCWKPLALMSVRELRGSTMPEPLINAAAVLDANFEWGDACEVPFDTFDILRRVGLDLTCLHASMTRRGNLYRASVLARNGA